MGCAHISRLSALTETLSSSPKTLCWLLSAAPLAPVPPLAIVHAGGHATGVRHTPPRIYLSTSTSATLAPRESWPRPSPTLHPTSSSAAQRARMPSPGSAPHLAERCRWLLYGSATWRHVESLRGACALPRRVQRPPRGAEEAPRKRRPLRRSPKRDAASAAPPIKPRRRTSAAPAHAPRVPPTRY